MKVDKMNINILAACTLITSGCSINQRIEPVPERLSSLCVEKNDDIFMDDYLGIIEKNLDSLKVPSKTVLPSESAKCQNVMRYKANWQWDIAMYLKYANFSVFSGEDRIGFGEYNSAGGGLRPDKFGTTEAKIEPILKELFKNQK
jgi:hypothetical protein